MVCELISVYAYCMAIEEGGSVLPGWIRDAFQWVTIYLPEELCSKYSWRDLMWPLT